jgi:type I restriction enzyme S subunit
MIVKGFAPYHIGYDELLMNIASTIIFSTLEQNGCTKKRLSEIIEKPQYGFTATSVKEPFGIKIVRITDIQKGTIDWSTVPYCECENPAQYLLKENDILFARSGSIGKSCIIISPEESIFASYLIRVRAKPNINPDFLFWFFQSKQYWTQILSEKIGSAQPNFNGQKLISLEICVPDISVQNSISEFLAAYQKKLLNESHEIPKLPSILHSVDKKVATLERLMAKIEELRRERAEAIEENEKICHTFSAKIFENIENFPLVDEICEVKGGVQKSQERTPTNNPRRYITVAHVQRNWIDINDPRFLETTDQEFERWKLLPGDVLVIEGNGSADQIGRTALFRGEIQDCIHQNHVIRIRPNQQLVDPEYLNVYLNSSLGQQQMKEISRTTSGLFNLSVGRIKSLKIPIPPPPEQRRIVAHLDHLQAKVDEVKRLQMETEREMEALVPAVLAKAFN